MPLSLKYQSDVLLVQQNAKLVIDYKNIKNVQNALDELTSHLMQTQSNAILQEKSVILQYNTVK